jgi:hypothetical protein
MIENPVVDLLIAAPQPALRRLEPVTCGIPWPRGLLKDTTQLRLVDPTGAPVQLQTRVLDRWSDHTVRWVLLDWQATVEGSARYRLGLGDAATPLPNQSAVTVNRQSNGFVVETGRARFVLSEHAFPFAEIVLGKQHAIDADRTGLFVEDDAKTVYRPRVTKLSVEEAGQLRTAVRFEGGLVDGGNRQLLDFVAYLHFFAASVTVRVDLTLRNSRKAEHPGGLWDLGSGGSVFLRDAAFAMALPAGDPATCGYSPEPGTPWTTAAGPVEIYQDSSGGDNWQSSNHLNRHHQVPNTFRGYWVRAGGAETRGLRATPVMALERGGRQLGIAMQAFWQNFPKALEASADGLTLRLFPRQYADAHEIQGGEQKTHTFCVAFDRDTVTDLPLAWCQEPLLAHATPEWYCASGAVPYLTPRAEDRNAEYLRLVDAAIEGDDTFDRKREAIDEYGWRHFGDIYGDHEAVFHKGPTPLVSHYNNQYDAIAGFAYHFLRSGDPRWWHHFHELAGHVTDIDIYHTGDDKSAYNHGLFWHTYHYIDADTGTHRSYPRAAKLCGGGPANEQNYTTGLMLHFFLTGNPLSHESAVGLARWVIDMDDGTKTVFRWLDSGDTGRASMSATPWYHGPGRGAANSIAALLDGHRLTGDRAYLAKAEQLIRRCVHPADNVAGRNLLDAENRWFYTMFLQSLGRYLDYKAERGELDKIYAYARASLLHYVRWMVPNEYPYLEKPEILEYPTETWAAQDMRKSEIFKTASKYVSGAERAQFLERSEFFFRYSTSTLAGMKTRTLCRPVVLLLQFGFMHACFQRHPDLSAPPPAQDYKDFGAPELFVPQKVRAKKRFVMLAGAGAVGTFLLAVVGLVWWLSH